jgi:hypothetical protein
VLPALAICFVTLPSASAADTKDPNALSLQVTALEMLHRFQASPAQLEALAKLAKKYEAKDGTRKAAKVSPRFLKTLTELRDAYVNGDEDKILNLSADLEELREKEESDLDDDVNLTPASREGAAAALKLFTARQVALYLSEFAEDFPDPLEKITDTYEDARTLKGKEWEEQRDLIAEQVGWLVGGLDVKSEEKVRKSVVDLLERVHALKDADFKKQKDALEKEAKELVSSAGPNDVIRNFMERTAAELLANPQLGAALEMRLKKVK